VLENRLGILGLISDGYWVEDHERDLIRVQSLSLRTTKDQQSLTKERDRRDGGEGTRAMELRMTRTI
jgi:hypothetical protein